MALIPGVGTSVALVDDRGGNTHIPARVLADQIVDNAGFSAVGASVLDPFFAAPVVTGGTTYNQAAGSLNIVAPATANSEFYARSVRACSSSVRLRFTTILSQRIANNNFAVMLADLIGEGLAFTNPSAATVNVTIPAHGWTAQMVGQFVNLAAITGVAGVPGRYAIASIINADTVQFTVAGWPGSGSGTLTVFGRNYVRNLFTGTTATTVNVDAQRNGWASGDTAATINTTASPGTLLQCELTGREVFWSDALRASSTAPTVTTRASRFENIPDQTLDLHVFLWSFNGSTAPATATTWTLGHMAVENFQNLPVYVQGARSTGAVNPLPVTLTGSNTVGTVTTVSTVSAVTSVAAVTSANRGIPGIIADVASAALTSTATTAAFTPTFGSAYSVNIPVTAVTGTTPTMDVSIEESDDSGTNWFKVYDFPRITAAGMYRSPLIRMIGNRVRYVQTVGGTTPSFTRAINRLQSSSNSEPVRQLIDRSVVLTTINSTTPSLDARDAGNRIQMVVNVGAITTTAPQLQLEGSDDNGASWYSIGSPLTAVASSTVQATANDINAALVRARVSTAGVGVTAGYVMVKAHD